MKMTKEEQRDLLVLEMKRCIELLESSNLNINYESGELSKKLLEVRRDSIRLTKSIYSYGGY